MGCHSLHQGIFPTQGLSLGLSHGRQGLYLLSHQGSLRRWETSFNLNAVISLCDRGQNAKALILWSKEKLSEKNGLTYAVTEQYTTGQAQGFSHLVPAVASSVCAGSPALRWNGQGSGHPEGQRLVAPETLQVRHWRAQGGLQSCPLRVHLFFLPRHLENTWVLDPQGLHSDSLKGADGLVLHPENSGCSHLLYPLDISHNLFRLDFPIEHLYLYFLGQLFLPFGGLC